MKGFQLTSQFGRNLAVVKIISLLGAFIYVRVAHFSPLHGPQWLFWLILVVLCLLTVVLYLYFGGPPERLEKQYLFSLVIDLVAISYLFMLHPAAVMAMLVGLVMVCGFYNFVLPRTSGILVTFLSVIIFGFTILLSYSVHGADKIPASHSIATLVVGLAILLAVFLLVRKIKRGVDSVYITTDELTLELTSHAIQADLSNDILMERNTEIKTLHEILSQIVAVLDWDELFENIIQAFRNRFVFDKCCIYLFEPETNSLELSVESGGERAIGVSTSVKPGQGLVGWCYSHGEGVLINDARNDPRYTEFSERGKRIRSIACQPLIYRGEQLGVLCLDSEKTDILDEKAFEFLESLTPLIAVAVSNSLSYKSVKAESNTDGLTGLNNHRGFMEKFLVLLETSYRENFPLELLIMDIDDFKQVNDVYGHMVGNLVLTELADILENYFRSADLVARWGGEEFVVVLNSTPPDIAPRICEQLRRKIEAHQFPISLERDAFKQVTVSLGLAAASDSNLEPELVSGSRGSGSADIFLRNVQDLADQIVKNADDAMYVAKREGKNQLLLSVHYPVSEPEGTFQI